MVLQKCFDAVLLAFDGILIASPWRFNCGCKFVWCLMMFLWCVMPLSCGSDVFLAVWHVGLASGTSVALPLSLAFAWIKVLSCMFQWKLSAQERWGLCVLTRGAGAGISLRQPAVQLRKRGKTTKLWQQLKLTKQWKPQQTYTQWSKPNITEDRRVWLHTAQLLEPHKSGLLSKSQRLLLRSNTLRCVKGFQTTAVAKWFKSMNKCTISKLIISTIN